MKQVATELGCPGLTSHLLRSVQQSVAHSVSGDESLNAALSRRLNHSRIVSQNTYVRLRAPGKNRRLSVLEQQRDERRHDSRKVHTFFTKLQDTAGKKEKVEEEEEEDGEQEKVEGELEEGEELVDDQVQISCPVCTVHFDTISAVQDHIVLGTCIQINGAGLVMCESCAEVYDSAALPTLPKHAGSTRCITRALTILNQDDNGAQMFSKGRTRIFSNDDRVQILRQAIKRAAIAKMSGRK